MQSWWSKNSRWMQKMTSIRWGVRLGQGSCHRRRDGCVWWQVAKIQLVNSLLHRLAQVRVRTLVKSRLAWCETWRRTCQTIQVRGLESKHLNLRWQLSMMLTMMMSLTELKTLHQFIYYRTIKLRQSRCDQLLWANVSPSKNSFSIFCQSHKPKSKWQPKLFDW